MELHIYNITNMFLEFWVMSRNSDSKNNIRLWQKYYQEPNAEIFNHLESLIKSEDQDFNIIHELEECFKSYENDIKHIKQMNEIINKEIEKTCENYCKLFNINDIRLNFIVMVGLYFANGMTTGYNGLTMFYFLEKIPSKEDLSILLAHEITHLFQFTQLEVETYHPTLAEHIFSEGLACYVSSILYPNFELSDVLFGTDNWIKECEQQFPSIKSDVIHHLQSKNNEYFIKYFVGNITEESILPKRIGYFIGYKVIKYLYTKYPLSELIAWQQDQIVEEVKNTLIDIF